MAKISKPILTIVLIVCCVALLAGFKYFQSQRAAANLQAAAKTVLSPRAKGNPKAEIKILEFIDFQCPACASGVKVIAEYLEKYPEKVYVEVRHFPLAMHKHGITSARWGECAARQDKFWPFLDGLIERQREWSALNDPLPPFRDIATKAGLNVEQIKECLNDTTIDDAIQADVEEGKMRKVVSTPSYFVNHEMCVGAKSLKTKVDNLLGIKEAEVKP
ncbi:MAG: thioredoxin domain-containing protein [Candidatus Omnitrophica bacterium]|nr:thioredoxin domain-containing protein [Candidatus Omnitrophota bacterium]